MTISLFLCLLPGSDIMMQLDDVVSSTVTGPRVEEAMHRSIRWLDRCIAANKNPDKQNLFAIIQGGLNAELRKTCLDGKNIQLCGTSPLPIQLLLILCLKVDHIWRETKSCSNSFKICLIRIIESLAIVNMFMFHIFPLSVSRNVNNPFKSDLMQPAQSFKMWTR